MKLPKIDERTKEDITQYMKQHLSSYVSEWRFDEQNPDAGTALAMIYAEMMSETIYRFNQVLEKNKRAFFSTIGAKLLPAIPANGYVTFSLVNDEVEEVLVRQGEQVSADTEDGESIVFETMQDVYVTTAKPECLYLCNKERDQISCMFEQEEPLVEDKTFPACSLFDLHTPNLQQHIWYFSHPSILNIKNEAWVYCSFLSMEKKQVETDVLQEFLNEENVTFEYYSEEGFVPFEKRRLQGEQIALKKGAKQPAFMRSERDGIESYWIRCVVKDIKPFQNFTMRVLALRSEGEQIAPDVIHANGVDQKIREFFPFGERASLYDEVYFMSEEVLGKKGASVTLEFDLEFLKVPLEVQETDNEINWKTIMKRSDIKVNLEFDISIAEVIWEYYNGEGFTRLFVNEQYADVFNIPGQDARQGTLEQLPKKQHISLHFQCPTDLEPVLVNSMNACCIRARVLKMNNLYKMKGNYITPLVSNPSLQYQYIQNDLVPEYFMAENNMERVTFSEYKMYKNEQEFYPLVGRQEDVTTLYMGFSHPLSNGPIKMLYRMEENFLEARPLLQFEYRTKKGWKNLLVIDETENFRKTGIITVLGNTDFAKETLFGKEKYWIRIKDVNHRYYNMGTKQTLQKLLGIYMNTTQVHAVETKVPEYFEIAPQEENKECQLSATQIHEIHVWVNEKKTLHKDALEQLQNEYAVRFEYAPTGETKDIWVEWKETEQFEPEAADKRYYQVDRIGGIVRFPNGRNGKIPTAGNEPTIYIEYSCGGGAAGNLPKGALQKLNRTIGFISEVQNPETTTGGCDQEKVEESLQRNAAAMRHGYRAVTTSDYEALAYEATRNICKTKCFANRNAQGEKAAGHITLVVLQKHYENVANQFDMVRNRILNYMRDHMSTYLFEQNRFHVIEPEFVVLAVSATIEVTDYNYVFDVRNAVLTRLQEFLNPMTGNYNRNGWNIGVLPNVTQIKNALKDIKGIYYIENIRLTGYKQRVQGLAEVDLEKAVKNAYVLPLSGTHEIIMKVNNVD
mgnify:CR=1 FL=1